MQGLLAATTSSVTGLHKKGAGEYPPAAEDEVCRARSSLSGGQEREDLVGELYSPASLKGGFVQRSQGGDLLKVESEGLQVR